MISQLKEYDFVVIGGGTMGLSTALKLHLQYPDAKTAIVQQYEFGNSYGGSHSQTRVIRSTSFNQFFRDLALQARDKYWPEMERIFPFLRKSYKADPVWAGWCQQYDNCRKSCNSAQNLPANPKSLSPGWIFPFRGFSEWDEVVIILLFQHFLLLPRFLLLLHHIQQRLLLAQRDVEVGQHGQLVLLLIGDHVLLLIEDAKGRFRLNLRAGVVFVVEGGSGNLQLLIFDILQQFILGGGFVCFFTLEFGSIFVLPLLRLFQLHVDDSLLAEGIDEVELVLFTLSAVGFHGVAGVAGILILEKVLGEAFGGG